ncbi:MAG: flagellar biosynthesis protein FlhB [Candidatus Margulisbacteria bacterium GWF2_35_9]|nr:MAG: flagellar biosynthesis protein FlhB [Candidatus Margulisbacteria bacterium GWF2_35_9]
MGDQGDKTEEPTPHKLREARKKGQVVKSKEITTAMLFFASYYVLKGSIENIWNKVTEYLRTTIAIIGTDLNFIILGRLLKEGMMTMLICLAPLMAANLIIAILLESLQTGFNFSTDALKPKLSKINPIEGFKRLVSIKGFVELAKSMAKMFLIVFIMQKTVIPEIPMLLQTGNMPILGAIGKVGEIAFTVAIRVGLFYVFIAILDYFWQRQQFMKQMRMTKQEIKDEYKKLEGDPMVKQRQRDMAMQMSAGRKGGGVAGADAVVTNPTHIAVAIQYDPEIMQSPRVIDKGKMLIAEHIKAIADENQILIVENKELAWELFQTTEIGDEIPPSLFSSVAEILALVYEIRKKRKKVA